MADIMELKCSISDSRITTTVICGSNMTRSYCSYLYTNQQSLLHKQMDLEYSRGAHVTLQEAGFVLRNSHPKYIMLL
jgi:uncharacterized protein YchJ